MAIEINEIKKQMKKTNRNIGDFDIIDPLKPIKVGCNSCGKCCRDRSDILLKPNDLYFMAKAMKKEIEDVLAYCDIYIGDNSQVPILAIKFRKNDDGSTICPFLKKVNDKTYHCRIHTGKPSVCRIYPLGRISEGETNLFILQNVNCVTEEEKIETTIDEWTSRKEIFGDEFFLAYFGMINELSNRINLKKMWKVAHSRGKDDFVELMTAITNLIYSLDLEKTIEENLEEYKQRSKKNTLELANYLKKKGYGVSK